MAATSVTVTNLTATTITVAGDEGKPVVTLGHAAGANTAAVNMGDLLGNSALCTTLASWITSGKVSITRGALTLPAADLTAYAQGSDMSRVDYDTDDDGVVDSAEAVSFGSVTASTTTAIGDSFLIYDLSEAATRKVLVPVAMDISVLTACADATASDDSVLIYDTSVGAAPKARKTSVADLLNPLKLTNAAAVAKDDLVILHDLTAPTIASKTTVSALLNPIALDAATVVEDADVVLIGDATDSLAKKMTVANLLARKVFEHTDLQAVAIDLTSVAFIAPAAGTIKGCLCKPGTGEPATGTQTMTVDVKINAASVLSAVMLMDAASAAAVVTGALGAGVAFVAGDVITVVRDYTVGGGGTLANTVVSVWANIAL